MILFCILSLVMNFSLQAHEEKPKQFAIITASYNNIRFYKKNLDSLFNQTYPHWELIYIDDISTDGTGEAVASYIKEKGFEHKVKFVANTEKCFCLGNYYREIHKIADDKIIVTLDGDDAFSDNTVLEYLNTLYTKNPNIWCTFGNYQDDPITPNHFTISPFPQEIIDENRFRNYRWNVHHLRSFYAGLFKNIKIEDFLYEGKFIRVAEDLAFMFPILEQCGPHHQFIDKVLYLYNRINPLQSTKTSVKSDRQGIIASIRKKSKYSPLTIPPYEKKQDMPKTTDLVLIKSPHSINLEDSLHTITQSFPTISKLFIIGYETGAFEKLKSQYPQATLIEGTKIKSLPRLLKESPAYFTIFCSDIRPIGSSNDTNTCMQALHKTGAFAFYMHEDKAIFTTDAQVLPQARVDTNIKAFQFQYMINKEALTNSLVLYKNEELLKKGVLNISLNTDTQDPVVTVINPPQKVGLFFEHENERPNNATL